jgi:uncharacterized protein (DUF885 family)
VAALRSARGERSRPLAWLGVAIGLVGLVLVALDGPGWLRLAGGAGLVGLVLIGRELAHRRSGPAARAESAPNSGLAVGRREVLAGAAAAGVYGALVSACARSRPPLADATGAGTGAGTDGARALLDDVAAEMLAESPEMATSLGVDVGGRAALRGSLGDRSWAAVLHQEARRRAALARLRAVDRDALSPELAAPCDAAQFASELAVDGARFAFGDHTVRAIMTQTASPYVVSQMTGSFFEVPQFLDAEHPIEDAADADAYLTRLRGFPAALDAESARVSRDRARGIVPPRVVLDVVLDQMNRYLATPAGESGLVRSLVDRCRRRGIAGDMETRAIRLVERDVLPALARQRDELVVSRRRATDAAGIRHLPDSERYYAWHLRVATTLELSASEVHAMGLDRSRAIEARMDALLRQQQMDRGTVGERMAALSRDPRFQFANDEAGRAAALAHVEALLAAARARITEVSRMSLRAAIVVRRVPPEIEAGAAGAYVLPGSLGGSRPATYWLNLRDTATWPRWALPTLTYHEALPGHVWQEAYGLERQPWPLVSAIVRFNAYSEGWALYAEQLADELGWYDDDPLARLGYLQSQLRRAIRLVVDTGLHARGWSRAKAIAWMVRTTGMPDAVASGEVDRYCVKPGQACGYMVGCEELLRLRARMKRRLGADLDPRAFNDAVIESGNLPFPALERAVHRRLRAGL